ncbi:MAG TPA: hypothetical protein VHE35_35330 [Kofleriaceae bacterium]|nr:hypothetical protein [Kofleriaceae bacterium]
MRRLAILSSSTLALVTGVLATAPACGPAPPPRTAESGATVVITGRVMLPPLHPLILFPNRVHGREHVHSGMNQPLDDQICGWLDKQQPRTTYGLKKPEELALGSLLRVRAVPWATAENAALYEGTLADDGTFRVEVPRNSSGYFVTVTGGDVHLRARILPPQLRSAHIDHVLVGLESTVLTDLAEALGPEGHARPDEVLRDKVGKKLDELVAKLRDNLTYGLWYANWAVTQHTKPYYVFNACTSKSPDRSCYRRGADVPYALMSASQLPADSAGWQLAGTDRPLGDEDDVGGVRLAAYRPAGAPDGASATGAAVEEDAGGFVRVTPVGTTGGVDLVFADGVHAVGMTIQNGTTHADTSGAFKRRGFRFTPMDRFGDPIQQYRWYTNQGAGGPGFYGVASSTPIARVRVEVRSPEPFTVGDVRWSATYPQQVADGLGWVATGNWQLVQDAPENLDFHHPYYTGYQEHYGDQFYNLSELAGESSAGRYWHVGYGPTATPDGSTLTSPAFSLNNLDLDADDQQSFSWWIIGTTAQTQKVDSNALGTDHKPVPFWTTGNPLCRIGGIDFLFRDMPFEKPQLMPGCTDTSIDQHYVAGMDTHWGHFHFRADLDVPDAAQWSNITSGPDRTERYVEYSTDNGATWRPMWWWPDASHHGRNGIWWKNHGHGLYDSDMAGIDWNGNGMRGTDFDKDGVDDYVAPGDSNGNGIVDADPHGDDAREWDTEWYMEYVPPSQWRDLDGDHYLESDIEGVTIRYRLRFVGPAKPTKCYTAKCEGWKIDDFAISNDNPRVGYYTSFDGAYDANLR